MTRPSRISSLFSAYAAVIWLMAGPAPAVAAPPSASVPTAAQEPTLNCTLVVEADYWFCRALEGRNCSLVGADLYWFCKSLVDRNCSVAPADDYWTCKGLTERNCSVVGEDDYWTCKGLTESCDLAPAEQFNLCRAVGAFFRAPASQGADAQALGELGAGLNCALAPENGYWFCRALEGRNCSLVGADLYWFCKSLVDRNCSVAPADDYWTCKGLTERNCSVVGEDDYWTCKGLTESCDLAPAEQFNLCRAIGPFFRAPKV